MLHTAQEILLSLDEIIDFILSDCYDFNMHAVDFPRMIYDVSRG